MTYAEQLATAPRRTEYFLHDIGPELGADEHKKLKTALTRAKKTGDGRKILFAVERAVEAWYGKAWPDSWMMWRIALEVAASKAQYQDLDYVLANELHAASLILFS